MGTSKLKVRVADSIRSFGYSGGKVAMCCIAIAAACFLLHCSSGKGNGTMSDKQSMIHYLKELNTGDDTTVNAAVAAMTGRAYEQTHGLIEIIQDPEVEESLSVKARLLLLSIGNLKFSPVLDSLNQDDPDNMMFLVRSAVEQHAENQARLVRLLDKLIDDKRNLTPPEVPLSTEERPAEKRVCDEAYVLMRGMCARENAEDEMVNSTLFISSMDEKERDREIARLKETKEWISLQEQATDVPFDE